LVTCSQGSSSGGADESFFVTLRHSRPILIRSIVTTRPLTLWCIELTRGQTPCPPPLVRCTQPSKWRNDANTCDSGGTIHVKAVLTSNIYRRSAPSSWRPDLVVTATLSKPSFLTVDIRGQTDSGTILTDAFRAEHFEFYDLTTSKLVVHDLFPGTCDPWDALYTDSVLELDSSKAVITSRTLGHEDIFSDPVNILEAGHEYRLTLKPQKLRCWERSADEMFGDKIGIPETEVPEARDILLTCDDVLVLKVEA